MKAAVTITGDDQRKARVRELAQEYLAGGPVVPAVALELLKVVRDHAGWGDVMDLVDRMPQSVRKLPFVREQRALAIGKKGNPSEAVAELTALIADEGETAERRGLLGGRYKELYRGAKGKDATQHLTRAIENYTAGMYLDLNDFYCSSNLPRLLRKRGRETDEPFIRTALEITRAACERKRQIDPNDPWLGQTLLGLAADEMDVVAATKLVEQIEDRTAPPWQLDTTDKDLQMSVELIPKAATQAKFRKLLERLRALK